MLNWYWALIAFAVFSFGLFALALWRFVFLTRASGVLLKKIDSLEGSEGLDALLKPMQNQSLVIELECQAERLQGEEYDEVALNETLTVLRSEQIALLKEARQLAALNAEWRDHVTSLKQLAADYRKTVRQWESLVHRGADTKQPPAHEPILLERLEQIRQDIKQEVNELTLKLRDRT
ncbi:hypothetical protein [Marinomonas sp. IMCC 4694]|uniref:hypothetical protein n=1 Tax=Marinomonas sp. IMCC 4694 TaxID=2605432 RepID=UPI0011E685E9|nr:hypothetical protein [Marinomonas sp. IMCC 4694]TYL48675.1 hypothetical protein FXV75_12485 [Marinomonas sp. IMCC 4694]